MACESWGIIRLKFPIKNNANYITKLKIKPKAPIFANRCCRQVLYLLTNLFLKL